MLNYYIVTPSHLRGAVVVDELHQENGPLPLDWWILDLGGRRVAVAKEDVALSDTNPGPDSEGG